MFEKTLTDVVKGIRASKRDTALYISQCIAEIKQELQSSDMMVKANALQKLTFLQMMGYGMSWASFATIEVMSSPRFAHKRIGYLAASQGFTSETEVILLTTNLLQKELRGASSGSPTGMYQAGLALNCISNICTADLARDLLPELTQLLTLSSATGSTSAMGSSSGTAYLRKKAILCLFKVFLKYPQALRLTFGQIQACLQDTHPAVVSCAVNVITELSEANPHNYLPLAPAFFDLLTTSNNNWMLIKVVKLLGRLVPCEPRLARKLLEPLSNIVQSTQAKSLLYEAVHTITLCLPYCTKADGTVPAIVPDVVALSAATLRSLVQEGDQNLKYLGLVGFASLLTSHPKVLSQTPGVRPLILTCLSDPDVTIRSQALRLLPGLATRKNLPELLGQLWHHVQHQAAQTTRGTRSTYRHELVHQMVQLCRADKYARIDNFEWYFSSVLLQLGHLRGVESHAPMLQHELINVALRVLPVRPFAVQQSVRVLILERLSEGLEEDDDKNQFDNNTINLYGDNGRGKHIMPEILPSLAWILGEYSDLLPEALDTIRNENNEQYNAALKQSYLAILNVLTSPWNVKRLTTETQKVYVQASLKVLAAASQHLKNREGEQELGLCVQTLQRNLPIYMQSVDVEVVERAFTGMELLKALQLVDGSAVPSLVRVDDEEDSDNESENGLKPQKHTSGDLLGLGGNEQGGINVAKPTSKANPESASLSSSSTLGSKIKAASPTLNALLKPSPMKPASAKAQRKKQNTPIGHSIDLDAHIDLSVFSTFLEEETAYLQSHKLSMESVSFTQQRPMATSSSSGTTHAPTPASIAADSVSSSSAVGTGSFQNAGAGSSQQQQRQNDPFYLNSGNRSNNNISSSLMGGDTSQEEAMSPSRLNTIQLPDDDDEDDDLARAASRKVKKEKKKKAKNPKKEAGSGDLLSFDPHAANTQMPSGDLLPGMGGATNIEHTVPGPSAATSMTIYDSDEDDEDEIGQGKNKASSKEYSNLSKVDLTAPLKEHEVIDVTNRAHRSPAALAPAVVGYKDAEQQPQQQQPQFPPQAASKSKKELKKERKEAKKKKKEQQLATTPTPGNHAGVDLLDLGAAFGGVSATVPTASAPKPSDAISSAFDDLLSMTAPAPAPVLPAGSGFDGMFEQQPATSPHNAAPPKKASRPWIKGSIKSSNASGPTVDWSSVHFSFRAYRSSQGDGNAAMIVARVENSKLSANWNDLALEIKDFGQIPLASTASPAILESSKVGPFPYPYVDSSFEMKGALVWSTSSVPVKFILPATLHLTPQEGLALEEVAQELSSASPPFFSSSAKVDIPGAERNMDTIQKMLCGFLRLAPVVDPSSANPRAATLAGFSSTGAKVRVLVKIKDSSVAKVDIRCTNAALGQALASDLKKVDF